MSENEINKVHVLIRRFLYETDEILHDAKACQQWLISFCKTLQFQDLCKNPNDYALLLLKEAKEFNRQQQLKAQKKQVRKVLKEQGVANPTKEEINAKWLELFGQEDLTAGAPNGNNGEDSKSATSCDQFTADGDTRKDSHDGKSGTSANNYGPRQAKNGDATHRDAVDESATVSNPLALDMPGTDKASDPRGDNTANIPPSDGPEDGNIYDQETVSGNDQVPDKVSAGEKGGCGPLEKPNSQKSPQPSLFPVAKPEKRRYGKYRHVLLTDDEGRKLRDALGEDLEDAVAILDEYIQSLPVKDKWAKKNGAKWWMQEYEAKDHYIVLHHGWARKRLNEMRTEELNARAAELRYSAAETNAKAAEKRLENANSSSQPRQMYLTSDDISRRNAEEGWRQLQLMHKMQGNG